MSDRCNTPHFRMNKVSLHWWVPVLKGHKTLIGPYDPIGRVTMSRTCTFVPSCSPTQGIEYINESRWTSLWPLVTPSHCALLRDHLDQSSCGTTAPIVSYNRQLLCKKPDQWDHRLRGQLIPAHVSLTRSQIYYRGMTANPGRGGSRGVDRPTGSVNQWQVTRALYTRRRQRFHPSRRPMIIDTFNSALWLTCTEIILIQKINQFFHVCNTKLDIYNKIK